MGNAVGSVLRDIAQQCESKTVAEEQAVVNIKMSDSEKWPFNAQVPRALQEGDIVTLRGKIADDTDSFTVALECMDSNNILYYFNVLFAEDKTIIKSLYRSSWEGETERPIGSIRQGGDFEMKICLLEEEIEVYFGNNHHSSFPRPDMFAYEEINYIQIREGLEKIHSLTVQFADN